MRELDAFRAPPDDAELARRRKAGLTERQDALLMQWGYPYVFEEFPVSPDPYGSVGAECHSELDGNPAPEPARIAHALRHVDQIALCGEREDGRFELLHRYTLAG